MGDNVLFSPLAPFNQANKEQQAMEKHYYGQKAMDNMKRALEEESKRAERLQEQEKNITVDD